MVNRRQFMHAGLGAVMLGLMRCQNMGMSPLGLLVPSPPSSPLDASRPFLLVPDFPPSVNIHGLPFAPWFFGDDYANQNVVPFHHAENKFPTGSPPAPTETVDITIVGGGLSGLTSAYLLRDRRPVLFELHPRFGGVSQGEQWAGTQYSQGGAYFIAPDQGTFLNDFYRELGLQHNHRLDQGANPFELNGVIMDDFGNIPGLPPQEAEAFRRYADAVAYFGENYPDIPFDDPVGNEWIAALDKTTFRLDVEARLGMPVPPLLAAGIQSYFYSSFNAGWEEISAASGWNFVAAEEFGRWVCPGGNVHVADVLWRKLLKAYRQGPRGDQTDRIRPRCKVVDVRLVAGASGGGDMVQVTWKDPQENFHSLLARRVIMANSKRIAKYIINDLERLDQPLKFAMAAVTTNAYVVANVLLDSPLPSDRYDVFMLGDARHYPMSADEARKNSFVADFLTGHFARKKDVPRSVLTLYWPLPWPDGVFPLLVDGSFNDFAGRLVPQIDQILGLLGIPRQKVRQVRMTRWGHAMPIGYPGFIAAGNPQVLRRGFMDRVFFANQDNWALPAFETAILEAKFAAERVEASLTVG